MSTEPPYWCAQYRCLSQSDVEVREYTEQLSTGMIWRCVNTLNNYLRNWPTKHQPREGGSQSLVMPHILCPIEPMPTHMLSILIGSGAAIQSDQATTTKCAHTGKGEKHHFSAHSFTCGVLLFCCSTDTQSECFQTCKLIVICHFSY